VPIAESADAFVHVLTWVIERRFGVFFRFEFRNRPRASAFDF